MIFRKHQPTAQQRIEMNFDRELNQAKDSRVVQILVFILILGGAVAAFLTFAQPVVRYAHQMTLQSNVRFIRTAVQTGFMTCSGQLEPAKDGSIQYYIAPDAQQDDANGSILRQAIAPHLPKDNGQTLSNFTLQGLLGKTSPSSNSLNPDYVYAISQHNGIFTLELWIDSSSYTKHPTQPDCLWQAVGNPYSDLSFSKGSFMPVHLYTSED